MKTSPPFASHLAAVALGLLSVLGFDVLRHPASARRSIVKPLPAATQNALGAEERDALPVIGPQTTVADAPVVDAWLRRQGAAKLAELLPAVLRHPSPGLRARWVDVLFRRWAEVDLEGSFREATKLSSALQSVAWDAILDAAPDAAWSLQSKLTDPAMQMHVLLRCFTESNERTALLNAERAVSLGDPFLRDSCLRAIVVRWCELNTTACATWATHIRDLESRRDALLTLLTTARRLELPDAYRLARSEPDPTVRRDLLAALLATRPSTPLILESHPDRSWQAPLRALAARKGGLDADLAGQLPADLASDLASP